MAKLHQSVGVDELRGEFLYVMQKVCVAADGQPFAAALSRDFGSCWELHGGAKSKLACREPCGHICTCCIAVDVEVGS